LTHCIYITHEENHFEEENLVNLELLSKIIKKKMIKDKLIETIEKIKNNDAPSKNC